MEEELHEHWLAGVLDMVVLSTLLGGSATGSYLVDQLPKAGLGPLRATDIAAALRRLETEGYLTVKSNPGERSIENKQYFITPTGKVAHRDLTFKWQVFNGKARRAMRVTSQIRRAVRGEPVKVVPGSLGTGVPRGPRRGVAGRKPR